jgi:hypothetical protein
MGLVLTHDDAEIVNELRGNRILLDVESHRINAPNGFMALMCSDCDQFEDKIRFLRTVSRGQCKRERVHLFALNGGGTLLSPTSPTRVGDEEVILAKHIAAAMKMKALDLLVSKCHGPCGACYAKNMNFNKVLLDTFKGKLYAKDQAPGLRVAVFPHVDYGPRRSRSMKHWGKKTYAITMHEWIEFALRKNYI